MGLMTAVGTREVPTRSVGPYDRCPSAEPEEGAVGAGQMLELFVRQSRDRTRAELSAWPLPVIRLSVFADWPLRYSEA
jgi:hypothetical protein